MFEEDETTDISFENLLIDSGEEESCNQEEKSDYSSEDDQEYNDENISLSCWSSTVNTHDFWNFEDECEIDDRFWK